MRHVRSPSRRRSAANSATAKIAHIAITPKGENGVGDTRPISQLRDAKNAVGRNNSLVNGCAGRSTTSLTARRAVRSVVD